MKTFLMAMFAVFLVIGVASAGTDRILAGTELPLPPPHARVQERQPASGGPSLPFVFNSRESDYNPPGLWAPVPGPDKVFLAFVSIRPGAEGFFSRLFSPTKALRDRGYQVVQNEPITAEPTFTTDATKFYRVRDMTNSRFLGLITMEDARRLAQGHQVMMRTPTIAPPQASPRIVPTANPSQGLPRARITVGN